jgi:hypothetical protein
MKGKNDPCNQPEEISLSIECGQRFMQTCFEFIQFLGTKVWSGEGRIFRTVSVPTRIVFHYPPINHNFCSITVSKIPSTTR